GRVLSGRHRIEAAKKVGIEYLTRQIDVESDMEALAIAFTANEGTGFSKHERAAIAKRLAAAGLEIEHIGEVIGHAAKRALIEAKLLADHTRSDRAIAKEVGVSHHTVADTRSELEGRGQIAHVSTRTDSQGRQQPSHRPKKNENSGEAKVHKTIAAAG